jgi:hypothetical protein
MSMVHRGVIMAALCLGLLAVPNAAHAEHVPSVPQGVVELSTHGRLFVKIDALEPFLELEGRFEGEDFAFRYRALTAGGYYRVHENLKLGAFYRLQSGVRHDDDWILEDSKWQWRDTTDRYEHVLLGDVSPRVLLPFLPGEDWRFMLKSRYRYNFFNDHQTLLVRPSLTYFWMKARRPVLTLSARYAWYFSLNYGDTPVYEHAPYLNVLYHLSPKVILDGSLRYRTVTWSTSEELAPDQSGYTEKYRALAFGLGVIVRLNPD